MDYITIDDLCIYGFHGVLDAEKQLGQRFILNLRCRLDLAPAARSDDTADTVNYVDIIQTVTKIAQDRRFNLVEALAGAVADGLLALDSRFAEICVRIRKPGAPTGAASGSVSVTLTRSRA